MIISHPLLQAFSEVVSTKSVHGAARALGLTQTAITQRIRNLEKELNLTLFIRSRRGMTLTPDGAALVDYCRALRNLEGSFLSRVGEKRSVLTNLTIVGPTSAISTRVTDDCLPLYSKFPKLRLHLQSKDGEDLIGLLKKGDADLAIVPPHEVPNEMTSKQLKSDRYVLVCSPKWKGRRLNEILETEKLIDFEAADTTSHRYLKKFGLEHEASRDRIYVNENEALIRLFANGVGFGTLTESVARPFLESEKLYALNGGRSLEEPLALVWYRRTYMPDSFAELVKSIR